MCVLSGEFTGQGTQHGCNPDRVLLSEGNLLRKFKNSTWPGRQPRFTEVGHCVKFPELKRWTILLAVDASQEGLMNGFKIFEGTLNR
jgi:hypothetical protein